MLSILFSVASLGAQDLLSQTRVSLTEKNRTLEQSLEQISLQTAFLFTYDASLVDGKQRILFGANALPLDQVLDSLLGNPKLSYRLVDRNIVIYPAPQGPVRRDTSHSSPPLVRGRIVDARTGKPLPFATLALYGTSLGTISNQDGGFSFKLPEAMGDPMLVASYLGYKNQFLPLGSPLQPSYEIRLEKEIIPLQEVIIRYVDPYKILRESIKRIPRNYLRESSAMTAYYRESVKREDRYMLYFESVLKIDKRPYDQVFSNDKVVLMKARKIVDTMIEDTVIVKLRSGVFTALNLDVVKARPHFLTPEFMDQYKLDFSDVVTYGDRLAYVISFEQKDHIDDLLLEGKIYLDLESLAIVAADFQFDPARVRRHPDMFLVNAPARTRIIPTQASYHAEYRIMDGRYHLSQVRAELGLKVRKRRKWLGARYLISFDMAITHVNPGVDLKIEREERLRPGQVLIDEAISFDPAFWGPHNTIKPEASLMESLRNIDHILQEISEEP